MIVCFLQLTSEKLKNTLAMTQKSKFEINVRISDVCSAAPFRRQPEHKFVGVQNIAHKKIFCWFWLTCANCRKRDWLKGRTKTKAIAWAKFIKKPTLTKMIIKGRRRIDWSPMTSETKLSLNYHLPNKIKHKFFMKK